MNRRLATLAAMLLLTASLTVATFGTASAQDPVPETLHHADGTWHNPGSGPISFKVTWKGILVVSWTDFIGFREESEEGETKYVYAHRWKVSMTDNADSSLVKKRKVGSSTRRWAKFNGERKPTMGHNYTVIVEGLDGDGESLGTRRVTVRPRHTPPPEPVTGLTLKMDGDNLKAAVNWNAPETGAKPRQYGVWLTNVDTGRARFMVVDTPAKAVKTSAAFEELWPGDNYRVSVRTTANNSRSRESGVGKGEQAIDAWLHSDWTSTTARMPDGATPSHEKVVPDLIWSYYAPGRKADPWAIGEATKYIVLDASVLGNYRWYDYPSHCKEYLAHDKYFGVQTAGVAVQKARTDAKSWDETLKVRQDALAKKKAEKQAYLDGLPEDQREDAETPYMDRQIEFLQEQVNEAEEMLAAKIADLEVKCASKFPVVENLTEADHRYYKIAWTTRSEDEDTDP